MSIDNLYTLEVCVGMGNYCLLGNILKPQERRAALNAFSCIGNYYLHRKLLFAWKFIICLGTYYYPRSGGQLSTTAAAASSSRPISQSRLKIGLCVYKHTRTYIRTYMCIIHIHTHTHARTHTHTHTHIQLTHTNTHTHTHTHTHTPLHPRPCPFWKIENLSFFLNIFIPHT
jgi:hypothetical protein